jgi:hypothetical protein
METVHTRSHSGWIIPRGGYSRFLTRPFQFIRHLAFRICVGSDTDKQNKQTPWSESASELYRPSDRRFSAK